MTPQEFAQETQQLEQYFLKIVKQRLNELANKYPDFEITVDYETHRTIEKLLARDGLTIYGMSANLDELALHLEFDSAYRESPEFPFDRLTISLSNDGNYYVRLDEYLFNKEWHAQLEDNYRRYLKQTVEELRNSLKNIEHIHMALLLRGDYQP